MRQLYLAIVLVFTCFNLAQAINPNGITGNFSICLPGPMTTQLTGTGTPASVNPWTSSNTAIATVNNSGLVTATGTLGATTITYRDDLGNISSVNVYVGNYPIISGAVSTLNVGQTVQLTGSLFPHPTSPWISSNPSVATVTDTGLLTGVSNGTFEVIYTNLAGCSSSHITNVLLAPTVSCGNWSSNSVTFDWNAIPGATSYSVSYSVNGGPMITAGSGNFLTYTVINVVPTDVVVLYVTPMSTGNIYGTGVSCQSAAPCPESGTLSGVQNICVGSTTSFTSTVPGGTWSSSNNAIATVNPTTGVITAISAGTAIMTYTVTGGALCPDATATRTVNVTNQASLILTSNPATPFQSVCSNTAIISVVYTVGNGATGATLTSGTVPTGVTGIFNAISGTFTLNGIPNEAGTFPYTVTTTGGCNSASLSGVIIVNPVLDHLFCDASQTTVPNSVYFDWQPIPGVNSYNYSYSIDGGPIIYGTTNVSHYEVLGVLPGQDVFFTVSETTTACSGSITTTCTNLSNEDFQTDTFRYFPNPVSNLLNLSNAHTINSVSIINTLGQSVWNKSYSENSIQIDVSGLASGIYLIKLYSDYTAKTIKIVKE